MIAMSAQGKVRIRLTRRREPAHGTAARGKLASINVPRRRRELALVDALVVPPLGRLGLVRRLEHVWRRVLLVSASA
jgi:hypothetical protein